MGGQDLLYFCFDGDKIGEVVQLYLMDNDLENAVFFSSRINSIMSRIIAIMEEEGASCIFRGGDSLIFQCYKNIPDSRIPYKFSDVSFSVGIGSSLQLAALGLFKAKASGRCRVGRVSQ